MKFNYQRAIRNKCIDCSAYSEVEVKECTAVACPNWPFRMGRKPRRGTQEAKVIEVWLRHEQRPYSQFPIPELLQMQQELHDKKAKELIETLE